MLRAADAGHADIELARPRASCHSELFDRPQTRFGMREHALREGDRQRDRLEGRAQRRRTCDRKGFGGGKGVIAQQKRIAVRCGPRCSLRADSARSTADIFDDDILAQLRAECRLDNAGEIVDATDGRPRNDQPDRPRRVVLMSMSGKRCGSRRGGQELGEMTTRKHTDTPGNTTNGLGRGRRRHAPRGFSRDSNRSEVMGLGCSPCSEHRLAGSQNK